MSSILDLCAEQERIEQAKEYLRKYADFLEGGELRSPVSAGFSPKRLADSIRKLT